MRDALQLTELFQALQATDNVTYILSDALQILRWNAAWETFARANDGEALLARWKRHTSLFDVVPDTLRDFYARGFRDAAARQRPWEHEYECSSPEVYRRYRMIAYPFGETFLVTHSLLVEEPHTRAAALPGASYERDGLITMCAHCRRVRSTHDVERWDWVPSYVRHAVGNISHGLCTACARYHYGDLC